MDIAADCDWTSYGLNVRLLHEDLACLEHRKEGQVSNWQYDREPRVSDTCGVKLYAYPYLVAKFLDVRLCKLLALTELFDPAIDFMLHFLRNRREWV